jgi:hypothetical protein
MGYHIDNDFTIDNDLEPQHAVRGGVLWTHVDDHLVGVESLTAGGPDFAGLGNVTGW